MGTKRATAAVAGGGVVADATTHVKYVGAQADFDSTIDVADIVDLPGLDEALELGVALDITQLMSGGAAGDTKIVLSRKILGSLADNVDEAWEPFYAFTVIGTVNFYRAASLFAFPLGFAASNVASWSRDPGATPADRCKNAVAGTFVFGHWGDKIRVSTYVATPCSRTAEAQANVDFTILRPSGIVAVV